MRYIILTLSILMTFCACSMGGKLKYTPERKMSDKLFRPCVKRWGIEKPLAKFCNRRCAKIKKKKCEKWDISILDMNIQKDFDFIQSAEFVLISEDQIL